MRESSDYALPSRMIDFPNIEFHREGYGMLADPRDRDSGALVCFPRNPGGRAMTGFCTCRQSRKSKSCSHFSQLVAIAAEIKKLNHGHPSKALAGTVWSRLATLLSEGDPIDCGSARARQAVRP